MYSVKRKKVKVEVLSVELVSVMYVLECGHGDSSSG